jgi:agarase
MFVSVLAVVARGEDVRPLHAPYAAKVTVDAGKERVIQLGSFIKSELDRNIYFRSYYAPGTYDLERTREMGVIGAVPGRGILTFAQTQDEYNQGHLEEDPARPGYPTAESLERTLNSYVDSFQMSAWLYPGVPFAMAFANYPEWTRIREEKPREEGALLEDWEKYFVRQEPSPEVYPLAAQILADWFSTLKAKGAATPEWYTIYNEPSHAWTGGDLADLTRVVAEALRPQHPEVKVAGPCSAWPYPGADWDIWGKAQKPFIEKAGDILGAYDLHFYSKGNWSLPNEPRWQRHRQPEPSLYEAQRLGVGTVWDYGRLEGYLDLFAAYHMHYFNAAQPRPMIVTEFGRQTIAPQLGPWENDFKPWLYMTTVIRQWLTYMDRPEVELTIPFILGETGVQYGPNRGQTIYRRPNLPQDPTHQVTRFREFYQFFRELEGTRVATRVDDGQHGEALRVRSFLNGNVLYLLIHNSKGFPRHPAKVDLRPALGQDHTGEPVKIVASEIRRLYYEGNIPDPLRDETATGTLHIEQQTGYQPVANLAEILLRGEETAIVRLTLSAVPKLEARITELNSYAPDTLLEIKPGTPMELTVPMAPWPGRVAAARLFLGLARDGGFDANPEVNVNGTVLKDIDLSWSRGVKNFHGLAIGTIPPEILMEGANTVTVTFPDSVSGGHPHLVTARLVVDRENLIPPLDP